MFSLCFLGKIIIEREETGLYRLKNQSRAVIFDIEGKLIISCDPSDNLFLENCVEHEHYIFIVDGCQLKIYDQLFNESLVKMKTEAFKFNSITREKRYSGDPVYSNCNPEWNKDDIVKSLLSWKSSLNNSYFPFWSHNSSSEPLETLDPKLRITLPVFINRSGYLKNEVSIGNKRRVLLKGFMVNGTIKGLFINK